MALRARPSLTVIVAACAVWVAALDQGAAFNGCTVKPTSPLVVNVKDKGAKGNGRTDDTASIQKAIDEVAGTGGTVYVPDGVYLVGGTRGNRLDLGSKMTFRLADRAVLKMIPNAKKGYSVLRLARISEVAVFGGTLEGDRARHKSTAGEWGMGIRIGPDAQRVTVANVTAKEMWGDGFLVKDATDVALCSVVATRNRRQGLSIIDARQVLVIGSVFQDTRGTRPSTGIDIEPSRPDQKVVDVRIEDSKFIHNAGGGIMIAGKRGSVENVEIIGNVFEEGRPILVENAPNVRSTAICDNRHVAQQAPPGDGLNAFADAVEVVSLQTDCREGRDLRFEVNRQTKKKNKAPNPAN
jgi:hypothetical protein